MTRSRILAVRAAVGCGLGLFIVALVGCGDSGKDSKAELPPPMVTVAAPTERTVTQYEYFTGRAEPLEQVEIRARVSGHLNAVSFEPGREVEKDKLLFEIDPEPLKAELARAKASLASAEFELLTARSDLTKAESRQSTTKLEYDRDLDGYKKGVIAVAVRDASKGRYDEAVAAAQSAAGKIKVANAKTDEAKANLRNAELNLGYCTIKAPITGVIGDRLVTEGNLVTGGVGNTTLLTTIVAAERMDVAFDVDENTFQRIQLAIREGKIKSVGLGGALVEAGLAIHGTGYPLKGVINFADNRVDQKTGTIRGKARFDNPKPANGLRLLVPGMYTRVRIPIGEPVKAMLLPDSAFGFDQGIRFIYVVGADNKAARLDVKTGVQDGDMRVVESVQVPGDGKARPLTASERVIVSGLQRVRPGMTVDPKPGKQ